MKNTLIGLALIALSHGWLSADSALQNSLQGTVYGATNLPLAGATVYVEKDGFTLVAVTNMEGRYEFPMLDQGTYEISAYGEERYGEWKGMQVEGGKPKTVDLVLSRKPEAFPLLMQLIPQEEGKKALAFQFTRASYEAVDAMILTRKDLAQAMESADCGPYQLILTTPGSAYFGSVTVRECGQAGVSKHEAVLVDGMAVSGAEFLEAAYKQALAPEKDSGRL